MGESKKKKKACKNPKVPPPASVIPHHPQCRPRRAWKPCPTLSGRWDSSTWVFPKRCSSGETALVSRPSAQPGRRVSCVRANLPDKSPIHFLSLRRNVAPPTEKRSPQSPCAPARCRGCLGTRSLRLSSHINTAMARRANFGRRQLRQPRGTSTYRASTVPSMANLEGHEVTILMVMEMGVQHALD